MTYQLRRQANGSYAVFDPKLGETMHPTLGPWEEATRLYVDGSGLGRSLCSFAPTGTADKEVRGEVVVFDVGLGGAANALAALACYEKLARTGRTARNLALISFEQDLQGLDFAVENASQLGYLTGYLAVLKAIRTEGRWEAPGVRWELRQGDFAAAIQAEPRRAEIVFYDPFSHRSNPFLWSVPVLESVYRCRRPGIGQRLVTYSSAFAVRAAMLLAGYYVGEGVRLDGRRTTIAAASFSDLSEPLDPRWLGRWRRNRELWPPCVTREQHKDIRARLLAHPQWSQFQTGQEVQPRPRHRAQQKPKAKQHTRYRPR